MWIHFRSPRSLSPSQLLFPSSVPEFSQVDDVVVDALADAAAA